MEIFISFYSVNWLAILAATTASLVILAFWYSPVLFGRPWRAVTGLHRTGGKGRDISTAIAVVFMLMWLAASALAAIMGPDARLRQGAGVGLLLGVAFISTSIGILGLLERRSIKLSAIDAGYFVVAFVVMGIILGSWH